MTYSIYCHGYDAGVKVEWGQGQYLCVHFSPWRCLLGFRLEPLTRDTEFLVGPFMFIIQPFRRSHGPHE